MLKCKYSQIHWHNYQAIFFPNLNISIKNRQIGGQRAEIPSAQKIQHNSRM